jgi:hypothetical protein
MGVDVGHPQAVVPDEAGKLVQLAAGSAKLHAAVVPLTHDNGLPEQEPQRVLGPEVQPVPLTVAGQVPLLQVPSGHLVTLPGQPVLSLIH